MKKLDAILMFVILPVFLIAVIYIMFHNPEAGYFEMKSILANKLGLFVVLGGVFYVAINSLYFSFKKRAYKNGSNKETNENDYSINSDVDKKND